VGGRGWAIPVEALGLERRAIDITRREREDREAGLIA
jgi:hypothetical protein